MTLTLTLPAWAWWLVGLVLLGVIINDVLRIVSWHLDRRLKALQAPPDWIADFLNRRAAVEQRLLDAYHGKAPTPDRDECRELALRLGVPEKPR